MASKLIPFFVLFVTMLLQNKVQGKPCDESQELDEVKDWFPTEERGSNQAVQNETLTIQGKRKATYSMTDFCQVSHLHPARPRGGCVKGRYLCFGYIEAVCKLLSFQCLSNVPKYGFPKCAPVYDFVTINVASLGKIKVRRTKTCHCA